MPVCPYCQTELALPNLPCQSCGNHPHDHPSLREGKSYSVRPSARTSGSMEAVRAPALKASEVPELELADRRVPKRPASPAGKPLAPPATEGALVKAPSLGPPAPGGPRRLSSTAGMVASGSSRPAAAGSVAIGAVNPGVGGAVFDEDDIFAPGGGLSAPLELDMESRPSAGVGIQGGTLAPVSPSPVSAPRVAGVGSGRYPSGRPVAVASDKGFADATEAAILADYGESPTRLWQAPLYAYRVRTRQAELRRQLSERRADLARARQVEEDAKLAFAERARPIAEAAGAFKQALHPIATHERLMLERDGALSAEMDAHKGRLSVIDERVQGLLAELEAAKADEHELEQRLAEAEAVRQRAETKLKRAEIEVRNAAKLAEAALAAQRGHAKKASIPE
jgi:hypothetical protein